MTMRSLLLTLLLIIGAAPAFAGYANLTITYQPDASWLASGDQTYLNLPIATITASRRLAVNIFADGVQVASVWDKPSSREYNVTVLFNGNNTSAHIAAQAVAYECGPWRASQAYSIGDKVCVGDYPSDYYWMQVTRAGTSGSVAPTWPNSGSVDDPDSSGVGWTFTNSVSSPGLVVLTSNQSRRQIGEVVDGTFRLGGLKFRVRNN